MMQTILSPAEAPLYDLYLGMVTPHTQADSVVRVRVRIAFPSRCRRAPGCSDNTQFRVCIDLQDLGADDGRSSGSDKTYACPFCSQSGLSEMMLADHVGDSHSTESKPVSAQIVGRLLGASFVVKNVLGAGHMSNLCVQG